MSTTLLVTLQTSPMHQTMMEQNRRVRIRRPVPSHQRHDHEYGAPQDYTHEYTHDIIGKSH
ncbi:MAG: hypothetical protein U0519_03785 [Candidatus Gracilibacteria bacterium]